MASSTSESHASSSSSSSAFSFASSSSYSYAYASSSSYSGGDSHGGHHDGGNKKLTICHDITPGASEPTFVRERVKKSEVDSYKNSRDIIPAPQGGCPGATSQNTPPEIELIGLNPFIMTVGTAFIDPGARATDLEDCADPENEWCLTGQIATTSNLNINVIGEYSVTYSVSDSKGASVSVSRIVKVEPKIIGHTCFIPDSLGDTHKEEIKKGNDNSNLTLQKIFDSKGFNIDVKTDQKQYQIWHSQKGKVSLTVEVVAGHPSTAALASVFGYYNEGNLSGFSPLFQRGSVSGFESVGALSDGGSVSFDIVSASTTGFAIKTSEGATRATQNSKNQGNYDQAVVYELDSNVYIIAFEDLILSSSDKDYNDLVVKLTVTGCEDPSQPEPAPTVNLDADPETINEGGESVLSWNTDNALECSADWTVATSTSGSQVVSPDSTTEYSITCTGPGGSATDTATVTVSETPVPPPHPSVSLTADPASITQGATSTLTWNSANTDACSAAWTSATSTSGSQAVSPTATTDYSITCTGPHGTVHATTTVTVSTGGGGNGGGSGGGGGGGGGGGIGGHRRDVSGLLAPQGEILGATSCSYLRDFLRRDWKNDPIEVLKLQSFLNVFEGENLSYTSVFDGATFQAVSRFQNKYFDDILKPWGHTAPTGFVYILTKKKVNEIYCNSLIQLTEQEQKEIRDFHAWITGLYGIAGLNGLIQKEGSAERNGSISKERPIDLSDILEEATDETEEGSTLTRFLRDTAASIMAIPQKVPTSGKYFVLVLILLGLAIAIAKLFSNPGDNGLSTPGSASEKQDDAQKPTPNDGGSPIIILPGAQKDKSEDKKDKTQEELPEEEIIIENFEEKELEAGEQEKTGDNKKSS